MVRSQVLTEGYSSVVVLLVLNYAFVGIATSAVVKYLDNMTKTFAANAAMFLVAVISIVFYNEQPTMQLFVGMFVAAIAVETYNRSNVFMSYKPEGASLDKAWKESSSTLCAPPRLTIFPNCFANTTGLLTRIALAELWECLLMPFNVPATSYLLRTVALCSSELKVWSESKARGKGTRRCEWEGTVRRGQRLVPFASNRSMTGNLKRDQ